MHGRFILEIYTKFMKKIKYLTAFHKGLKNQTEVSEFSTIGVFLFKIPE